MSVPIRRNEDQIYLLVEREPFFGPIYTQYNRFNGYFNWTMTYRWDFDILFPYGHVILKGRPYLRNRTIFEKIYEKKKYDAIWLVSHCDTYSKREHYVAEFKWYMDEASLESV